MRSLLHEWGNVLPGPQLKSLPRLLEHGCSQNAVADFASSLLITLHGCLQRKARHVSSPVHITEQQQNRGTQQSLMPAEPTATGHPLSHGKGSLGYLVPKTASEKMQGAGEINYHDDGERQPWNNTRTLCHFNTNKGG